MSYERQLPYLYLRGSLCSITMKEMTPEEKQKLELVYHNLLQEPELEKTKIKFRREFNRTIRCDYIDEDTVEQDYNIALWRALADLLIHRKITGFTCEACGANSYINSNGQEIKFNQCYHISPCCNRIKTPDGMKNPDECTTAEFESSKSPIKPHRGDRKYSDDLLNDRFGLIRFISKHIYNYQQMVIKENQRATYFATKDVNVNATANAVSELLRVINRHGQKTSVFYMKDGSYISMDTESVQDSCYDSYKIAFDTMSCNTDLIVQVMLILQNHVSYGIIHTLQDDCLILTGNPNATISTAKTVREKVKFSSGKRTAGSDESSDGLDNYTHGGTRMTGFGDNHENHVEMKEIIQKIANSLNNLSRVIWILQVQSSGFMIDGEPDRYNEYTNKYPGTKLNNTDLADYLGVSTRIVKRCKEEIETQCFFHGLS